MKPAVVRENSGNGGIVSPFPELGRGVRSHHPSKVATDDRFQERHRSMKTKIGSVLLTLLPFFGMAEEANYTQIDLSGMTADMVITGKNYTGVPAQYTISDRKAIHAFNGDGIGAGGTHTNSANGTMFMSSAFCNSGTPYSYPIYLQVDLGEVKAIDRVKF